MAHINCPKCDKRLRLPEIREKQGVRCPTCTHEFVVSPPDRSQPLPDEYAGEGTGVFAKTFLAVLTTLGIALIAVLIYKAAIGPGDAAEPVQPDPIASGDAAAKLRTPEQIFAKASPSVVYITVRDKNFKPLGVGSGFFIDAKGLIATNYHIIRDAEFATVLLNNKTTVFVDGVTATDPDADLAILKVSGKGFVPLSEADNILPNIGSAAYAIGNPRGLENTFSDGMISGHREFKKGVKIIQTTAPISPGSSGGPLLNGKGEVVGVTTSYLVGSQNLNFAVSIASLRRLAKKQGKPKTLASAGGGQFDTAETDELDRAWAAINKKDWTAASKILLALRKTQKNNPFVWFTLGYLHSRLGNYKIAIQHYKAAIIIKPDYAKAYHRMGYAYDDLGLYADAITAYKKAITIKSDFADAYCNMGVSHNNLKQYAAAMIAYRKAISIEPDHAVAYANIGARYGDLGQHADAIAACEKAITIKPDCADAYNTIANSYKKLGRHADAIVAYKKAIAIKPDYANAYYNVGVAYGKLGRHAEAIVAYKKAVAIKPDDTGAYLNLSGLYYDLGRYDDSLAACKKAIALRPDYPEAYDNMGNAYGELKQYALAIAAFEKAIVLKPDHASAYSNMGTVYDCLGRYADAIAAFKMAIVLKPDCAVAYSNMGDTYNNLGMHVDALAACDKAIAIKPDLAESYYNMGVAYEKLKQDVLAITAYEKAIALKPKARWSSLARSAIRRLRRQ